MQKKIVDINLQPMCVPPDRRRGIPYYVAELVKILMKRQNMTYTASFFDFKKERGNLGYVKEGLGDTFEKFSAVHECNELDFRDVLKALATGNPALYNKKTYEEYIGARADVYHFLHLQQIMQNVSSGHIVVTVHDLMPMLKDLKCYWSDNVYAQFENALEYVKENENIQLIADSENTKTDLIQIGNIQSERISVIYPAYNKSIYYPEYDDACLEALGIHRPYVLYLGGIDYRKGIDVIIEAVEKLREKSVQFVLAGPIAEIYEKNNALEKARRMSRICLPGFVTDEEKRVLMSSAECFVFPSQYEGFGLPVLEAMACGTPVITTNVSSLPEVGGDAVCYIEPGNAEQLAAEIDRLLSDSELRDRYKEKGLLRATKFSWDKTAALTEKVYEQLV